MIKLNLTIFKFFIIFFINISFANNYSNELYNHHENYSLEVDRLLSESEQLNLLNKITTFIPIWNQEVIQLKDVIKTIQFRLTQAPPHLSNYPIYTYLILTIPPPF